MLAAQTALRLLRHLRESRMLVGYPQRHRGSLKAVVEILPGIVGCRQMSKGQVKPSLVSLSRETFHTDEEAKRFAAELLGPSDRACAIIGASYLERSLLFLIHTKMRPLTKAETDSLFFDQRAILKTFSERIEIAYALEIIDKSQKNTLDAIRRIRNVFAHAVRPITFEHALVIAACKILPHHSYTESDDVKKLSPHRGRYVQCVMFLATILTLQLAAHPRRAAIVKLVTDPYAHEP